MGVRDSHGFPKGGKSWFAVESKSFEISIEEIRGRLRGTIWERSKGLSSWIRFGEKGLSLLLEGVEAWCRGESTSKLLKVWDEGARKFSLECRSNAAGRFLLCSVRDAERKKFCLVFPEGSGLVGGWVLLAKNLRALGVSPTEGRISFQSVPSMGKEESNANTSEKGSSSYAEVVKGKKGMPVESMRVNLGEKAIMCREEQLGRCLVGCFGGSSESIPSLPSLKRWAYEVWLLKGEIRILRGSRRIKDREFLLQRWGPIVGCTWKESQEVWVRVVGLPLHLWSREVFKSIGDCCGGFVAVDEDTTLFSQLQWARILVKNSGMKRPGTMEVEAGNTRWELCLWWEAIPRVLQDGSCLRMQRRSEWEVRDEGGGASRAESRVREPKAVLQKGRLKYGLGRRPAPLCPKLTGWTKGIEELSGLFNPEAHLDLLREPVPSRAHPESVGILTELEQEMLVANCVGGMEPSLGHQKPADDALLNEVSRYPRKLKSPNFSLGCGAFSPSSHFLGSDGAAVGKVGVISGLFGAVEEERSRDLSVHEDGNMSPRASGDEANGTDLAIVPFGGVLESPLVETMALQVEVGDEEEVWSSSCLAKFSHCLGMPTVGFEEEILYLLRRMRGRIEKKNQGAAGGVLVFWDNRVVDLLEVEEGIFSVSCLFKNCMDGMRWVFTGVYGPVCRRDREVFWEELGSIKGLWRDPWCVGGDFNMIRYPEERSRGGELSASMRRFTEVVEDLELRDYPLQGGLFTWRGGLNNQSQSRLDRFLVTDEWDRMFNGAMQGILARPVSDHFPILLEGGGLKRGPSPFRFENMWLEERGFIDRLKSWWGSLSFTGLRREKLSARWCTGMQWENHSTLSLEDCEARKEAQEAYKTWVLREEISWRQRSRELWLKEGDNNTKFFHRMANAHSRRNWLSRLKVDDCWHTEELDLKNSVVGAFNNLYTEKGGWRPGIEGLPFLRLNNCEVEGLEIPFSEGEVFVTLSDLGKDKAPGPDGFTMAFWSFSWDLVKAEIMGFFKEFHERGSLYKLLAKTDLDAVLIANEAVDSRLKDNVGGVLCKLDIEKAYDRVSWSFLLAVLKEMGFGKRWIKWIDWCISTVKFSVLVNGSPSGFFQSTRGLRQGDPLSPYLFVIAMEVFSSMMRRAISGGYLAVWKVSGGRGEGMHISHLLFADDTLVFCEDSPDEMTYLSWLLMWFEACSGLRINLEKSEIILLFGNAPWAAFNSLAVWNGVEERFRRRLAMWKRQYISKGGRLTLIRSTMFSMPIYLMSLFHLPRKVRMRLEKIQRDFLWGGGTLAINLTSFANERDALWRSVISLKYGVEEGGWCTRDVLGRNGVGLWKAIRKKWGYLTAG
ncbi:LINE-1 reverse transcriptase-like [Vitis vinifera]|uniref:LINE-1 reverse transcriptase-like n=1 Tax=Vitis vinifera TaxID=29760 RepID=A0A438F7Y1_VITVI|nr:LINE-1 reverse transcriptase-like [Vitis vinifera]